MKHLFNIKERRKCILACILALWVCILALGLARSAPAEDIPPEAGPVQVAAAVQKSAPPPKSEARAVAAAASAAEASPSAPATDPRLTKLMEQNTDAVGWIAIPGTNIDYPVVRDDNNNYYLTHDELRQKSDHGAIFMDHRSDAKELLGNIILYGHHMKDGSMFAGLVDYKQEDFFYAHRTVKFETAKGTTTWEIFSAYVTDPSFYYIQTDFADDQAYADFIGKIEQRSLFPTDASVAAEDPILTLSTCTYEFEDARFAVHARRIG